MLLMYSSSSSKFFASAFDSAFFRRRLMNLTDFSGQRPADGMLNFPVYLGACLLRTLCRLELLGLAGTANTTSKTTKGDDLLVFRDVTKVCVGLGQLETCNPAHLPFSTQLPLSSQIGSELTGQSGRHLAHVLEMSAQVLSAGARSYRFMSRLAFRTSLERDDSLHFFRDLWQR